ncbi:hypothetical protein PILCRDRAFT_3592 [Piloderma croceum F 1598]|uniref:Uncharacterized protein n=1 Tax=Piloderma croceum (strain F 1598) TaxID=765440 RepID=A0A0C3GB58_PILCF|nr:hypothetical protein PILCRDRAFT_3592 [Piloderma croceum F 1598]
MSTSTRKRKQRHAAVESPYGFDSLTNPPTNPATSDPDPALFIQAHEAEIVRGPQARIAAASLEVKIDASGSSSQFIIGDGLIRWGDAGLDAARGQGVSGGFDEDDDDRSQDEREVVWVDRYDARLLLETLPPSKDATQENVPGSPSGWSDLPSDTEDTFFFTPDETDEYRRDKRRRVIDQSRETRLKALRASQDDEPEEEVWGGSDEEATESQKELMRRTATHILSSPNPAQLEMRILANYGGDKRFAFLRGRWAHAWKFEKGKVITEITAKKQFQDKEQNKAGLGVLADYGDSDEEEDEETDKNDKLSMESKGDEVVITNSSDVDTDAAIKEARRARAKEWAEKRRALTSSKS